VTQSGHEVAKTYAASTPDFCCDNISGRDEDPQISVLQLLWRTGYVEAIPLKHAGDCELLITWNKYQLCACRRADNRYYERL